MTTQVDGVEEFEIKTTRKSCSLPDLRAWLVAVADDLEAAVDQLDRTSPRLSALRWRRLHPLLSAAWGMSSGKLPAERCKAPPRD